MFYHKWCFQMYDLHLANIFFFLFFCKQFIFLNFDQYALKVYHTDSYDTDTLSWLQILAFQFLFFFSFSLYALSWCKHVELWDLCKLYELYVPINIKNLNKEKKRETLVIQPYLRHLLSMV